MDLLNEKIERETYDKQTYDCVDFDTNIAKVLSKKCKYKFVLTFSKS